MRATLRPLLDALENVLLCEPVSYGEFARLLARCHLVITDSGGIQEETTYLGVPCLTMRENTERPITVERSPHVTVHCSSPPSRIAARPLAIGPPGNCLAASISREAAKPSISRTKSASQTALFSKRCIPSGRASLACSANCQPFLRSTSAISPRR